MIGEAGDQVTVNAAEANASRMRDASLLQDFCTKRKKDARRELAKDNRGVCVAAEEEGGACCAAGEGNFSIARGGENRKTGIGLCGTQRRIDIIPPPHLHPSKPYNLCRQPRQQQNLIHDHSVSHLARQLSIGKCHDIFAYGMRNIVLGVSVRHTVCTKNQEPLKTHLHILRVRNCDGSERLSRITPWHIQMDMAIYMR